MLVSFYPNSLEVSKSYHDVCQIQKVRILLLHTHEIDLEPEGKLHCISIQNTCETVESPPYAWLSVDRWWSASCRTTMAFQASARVKVSRSAFSKPFAPALISAIETGNKGRFADSAAHSTHCQISSIRRSKHMPEVNVFPNPGNP